MKDNIQVSVFIPDSKENTSVITITRYGDNIQIRQGDNILGSITLIEDKKSSENASFEPMAVINIMLGVKLK